MQEWVPFTSISSLNKEGMVLIERNLYLTLGEQTDPRDHMEPTLVQHLLTFCRSLDRNLFSKDRGGGRKSQGEQKVEEPRKLLQPREGSTTFPGKERITRRRGAKISAGLQFTMLPPKSCDISVSYFCQGKGWKHWPFFFFFTEAFWKLIYMWP